MTTNGMPTPDENFDEEGKNILFLDEEMLNGVDLDFLENLGGDKKDAFLQEYTTKLQQNVPADPKARENQPFNPINTDPLLPPTLLNAPEGQGTSLEKEPLKRSGQFVTRNQNVEENQAVKIRDLPHTTFITHDCTPFPVKWEELNLDFFEVHELKIVINLLQQKVLPFKRTPPSLEEFAKALEEDLLAKRAAISVDLTLYNPEAPPGEPDPIDITQDRVKYQQLLNVYQKVGKGHFQIIAAVLKILSQIYTNMAGKKTTRLIQLIRVIEFKLNAYHNHNPVVDLLQEERALQQLNELKVIFNQFSHEMGKIDINPLVNLISTSTTTISEASKTAESINFDLETNQYGNYSTQSTLPDQFQDLITQLEGESHFQQFENIGCPQLTLCAELTHSIFRAGMLHGKLIYTEHVPPGGKQTLSETSLKTTKEERKAAESTLESNGTEAKSSFEDSFEKERERQVNKTKNTNLGFGGSASGNYNRTNTFGGNNNQFSNYTNPNGNSGGGSNSGFNWGRTTSVGASLDVNGNYNRQLGKNITNSSRTATKALAKHSSSQASKRDVNVSSSSTNSTEITAETTLSKVFTNPMRFHILNIDCYERIVVYEVVTTITDLYILYEDGMVPRSIPISDVPEFIRTLFGTSETGENFPNGDDNQDKLAPPPPTQSYGRFSRDTKRR